jgi:hypothetical protein
MIRPIFAAFIFISVFGANLGNAQQSIQFKNFASFKQLVAGVDFYASNRQAITSFEKPAADAIAKLRGLFGVDLPKGAIFICSTLAQKDAVYEPRVIKAGYGWTLTVTTPEVKREEMMASVKSQTGGNIPAEFLSRMKNTQPNMTVDAEKQMVTSTIQQISYAVVQVLLVKDLQYRSRRLDDMGKSPLPDWMDIGIASYVSSSKVNIEFLQKNMDQTFPIEDVLTMARPFVSSSSDMGGGSGRGGSGRFGGGTGGGPGMPQGGSGGGGFGEMSPGGFGGGNFGGMPPGGFGGGSGGESNGGQTMSPSGSGGRGQGRGDRQRTMSKDEQDRALFDSQAGTFFAYIIEKAGIEKVKEMVKQAQEGKESREFITRLDILGPDFEKIEGDWTAWVKSLTP